MLTGAGTFAREAALLGVPAVSFFPRNEFLTVDVVLQEQGKQFKSRSPQEIKQYVDTAQRTQGNTARSEQVLAEVLQIFDVIILEVKKG
jgi:predicted glycosyltransferase